MITRYKILSVKIFLKYSWIKDENKKKPLNFRFSRKQQYSNQRDRVKSEQRGKVIALNTYINTKERMKINIRLDTLGKNQQNFGIFNIL